ncbi:hypothetical protein [Prauserella cavernicola]|uniref:Uncharacterized protein n=1 Tax=Prauserella cavernicola TaxID=2800127 RepID=A0A934QTT8_9PSEU|nr:hypothetical protein [Prauserella cavernicola]MBK1785509.1 hypothetical protein [Prauserella cavernicola]
MDSVVADIVDLLAENDQRNRDGGRERDHNEFDTASPEERGVPLPRHANGVHTRRNASESLPGVDFVEHEDRDQQELPSEGGDSPGNQAPNPDSENSPPSGQRPGRKRSIDELGNSMGSGSVLDQVETLGTVTFGRALNDVEKQLGRPVPPEVKKALSDHFWCDFLANIARYVTMINRFSALIPDTIAKWASDRIIKWRHEHGRIPLEEAIIRTAAKSMCKTILELTKSVDFRSILLMVRILAILACKSPERHKAVTKYCVDPLCKHLTVETKRRLTNVIEQEWIPAILEDGKQSTHNGKLGQLSSNST